MADAVAFTMEQDAEAIFAAAPDGILNIGVGDDLTIGELAKLIKEVIGSKNEIVYDTEKPDGTPRKLMDVSRVNELGWKAQTTLREGIQQAYQWYQEHYVLAQAH